MVTVLNLYTMQLMWFSLLHFIRNPLTFTWFQRISSHSERAELSPSWTREHKLKKTGNATKKVHSGGHMDGMVRVKRISWPGSGASLCRSRCCSSGTSCCSAWRGRRRARWGTFQSSRPRRSCRRDSRWSAWGQKSERLGRRWGKAAFPGGTGRGGGHPSRSHPPSQRVETWARIHFQVGHVSETRGFPHSYSSPAKVKENLILWNT